MGEMVSFKRPDGKDCRGYLATPKEGSKAPALVVIQEWWGLNEQMKRTADRYAEAGYRALVPDLFRGKIAGDEDEANHLMDNLDFMDAAEQDIRGAVDFLRADSNKCGVTGYCMGGALTLLSALKVPEVQAAVVFYGIPPAEAADLSKIAIPLQCHFANKDDWCTPEAVDALEKKLKEGRVSFELFRYDAQHGFMRDGSEVHNPQAAKQAWERTLDFWHRTIGG